MVREALVMGKGSSADGVWPGKQGWQSITKKVALLVVQY